MISSVRRTYVQPSLEIRPPLVGEPSGERWTVHVDGLMLIHKLMSTSFYTDINGVDITYTLLQLPSLR